MPGYVGTKEKFDIFSIFPINIPQSNVAVVGYISVLLWLEELPYLVFNMANAFFVIVLCMSSGRFAEPFLITILLYDVFVDEVYEPYVTV